MWTRKELKTKGKTSFRSNYWKSVLVALVLTIAMGAGFSVSYGGFPSGNVASSDGTVAIDDGTSSVYINDENGITIHSDEGDLVIPAPDENADDDSASISFSADAENGNPNISLNVKDEQGETIDLNLDAESIAQSITPGFVLGLTLTFLIVFALGLVLYAFIFNPLQAGCRGFFTANLNRPAEVREITSPFDRGYVNCVKAMILRDVFIFLWTLLLIVPGIVKSYEYRMIPYLVAENPNMTWKEAFAESRQLMHGNKWKAFVLDLSFIGWAILSALTLGLLGIFYVSPYYSATSAALYEELKYGNRLPDFASQPVVTPAHAAHAK